MLLGWHEEVLLSDFGIATVAHSTGSLSAEAAVGTIAYMAPEQIQGHPRPASDQYALGVTVYEWLCGERPFSGSFTELVTQHLWQSPPPLQARAPAISSAVEQVVLRALAKDPKQRFATVAAFTEALEQASQEDALLPAAPASPGMLTEAVLPASRAAVPTELAISADTPQLPTEYATPQGEQATDLPPAPGHPLEPTAAATPLPADVPLLPTPALPVRRRRIARTTAALLIGLVVLVVAGGILGSLGLLAHFGVIGARSSANTPTMVRGGTWVDDFYVDPDSLIPYGAGNSFSTWIDQALYLPLFYSDPQGVIHPAAATEVPTLKNGGISPDAKTWTFHLRPNLVWSDGQPYDARDVDYSWKLWVNPRFGAIYPFDPTLISRAVVSADNRSITFYLTRAYAPFLSLWVDGAAAPLPAHHFSRVAPEAILKSPENLNPQVTSGPFMMAESLPADHFTLVRNPRYYLPSAGLPYLDKVVFRIVTDEGAILKDLQAGIIDSTWLSDVRNVQEYQRLYHYTIVTPPTNTEFEALYFNFHNVVLGTHLEVRQAIAMAIDHQALIQGARHGFATSLCTDHGSFFHPGYDATAPCPVFDPAVANKLLDDNGWIRGPDGVRTRDGQRLEFEYSTVTKQSWSVDGEAIIARNLQAIGIKLDIQNYPDPYVFYGPFLDGGKASPPTGAISGRFDIAEFTIIPAYDPDDSGLLSCDQIPPRGQNIDFYCNPALDALYTQEQATADPGLRQQVFIQIHRIYLTDFPFIVLYSPTENFIVRKGTHNYQPSPFSGETVNLWQWWCDNGKC